MVVAVLPSRTHGRSPYRFRVVIPLQPIFKQLAEMDLATFKSSLPPLVPYLSKNYLHHSLHRDCIINSKSLSTVQA